MPLKVGWVGNSYTYFFDMPGMVAALASGASPPVAIEHKQALHGGWTLGQHWRRSVESAMEPTGIGRVDGGARDLLEEHGPFDFVVLQDQSQTPGFDVSAVSSADLDAALAAAALDGEGDEFLQEAVDGGGSGPLNRAESLRRLQEDYAPAITRCGANIVLYSTWGRQSGQENANAPGYATFAGMLRCLTDGVREYSAVLQAAAGGGDTPPRIAPAGTAFALVRPMHFDRLYVEDKAHPSFAGSYLVACVFFAVLTGASPVGLSVPDRSTAQGRVVCDRAEAWANAGKDPYSQQRQEGWVVCELTAEEAKFLQQMAHEAVLGSAPAL